MSTTTDHPDARAVRVGPDEGTPLWFLGNLLTVKVSGAQTRRALTVAEVVNPPGFAPPLHRHVREDEIFYVLEGTARFWCDGDTVPAAPGDLVLLPVGLAHCFRVGADRPLRVLQLTTPAGFEAFAAAVGEPALERRIPDPGPLDPAELGRLAALHGIEILGPPPDGL